MPSLAIGIVEFVLCLLEHLELLVQCLAGGINSDLPRPLVFYPEEETPRFWEILFDNHSEASDIHSIT